MQQSLAQREWHNNHLNAVDFVYPVFLIHDASAKESIPSFPNQFRYGINRLLEELDILVSKGLQSILLFGSVEDVKMKVEFPFY